MRPSSAVPITVAVLILVASIVFFAGRWLDANASHSNGPPTAQPVPERTPPPRDVKERIVRGFYDDVSAGKYARAYDRLSGAFHNEEPYDEFVARYADIERIDVRTIDVAQSPTLDVVIVARRRDVAAPPTIFKGLISLAYDPSRGGWMIAERDLKRVAGDSLGARSATPAIANQSSSAPASDAPAVAATTAANCYTDKIASVDTTARTVTVTLGDTYHLDDDANWSAGQVVTVCLSGDSAYALTVDNRTVNAGPVAQSTAN